MNITSAAIVTNSRTIIPITTAIAAMNHSGMVLLVLVSAILFLTAGPVIAFKPNVERGMMYRIQSVEDVETCSRTHMKNCTYSRFYKPGMYALNSIQYVQNTIMYYAGQGQVKLQVIHTYRQIHETQVHSPESSVVSLV